MKKTRLLLADDHAVVREGLRAVFAAQADMEVVAEAADGDEALAQAVRYQPDVLLMDLSMPGCNGRQLIQNLNRRAPSVAVLVLSMHREEQYAAPMIRAGAKGFVTKTRSPRELVEATRKVAEGGVFISRELADRIAFSSMNPASAEKAERLSCREQEILVALATGQSVTALAARLHLSPKTVSTHKTRIFKKLGMSNLPELVRYALDQGLL